MSADEKMRKDFLKLKGYISYIFQTFRFLRLCPTFLISYYNNY